MQSVDRAYRKCDGDIWVAEFVRYSEGLILFFKTSHTSISQTRNQYVFWNGTNTEMRNR